MRPLLSFLLLFVITSTCFADLMLVRVIEKGGQKQCDSGGCRIGAGVGIGGLQIGAGVGIDSRYQRERAISSYSTGTPLQKDTNGIVWILVAGHSLEKAESIQVQFKRQWYSAYAKGYEINYEIGLDCGLIYAKLPDLKIVYVIGENPRLDQTPYLNGFPYGRFMPRQVHIKEVNDNRIVLYERAVDGESGGPLFVNWKVAGVVWGNVGDPDGWHGRATSATALRKQLAVWGLNSPPKVKKPEGTITPSTVAPVEVAKEDKSLEIARSPPTKIAKEEDLRIELGSSSNSVSSVPSEIGSKTLDVVEKVSPLILWALGISGITATGGTAALGIWLARVLLERRKRRKKQGLTSIPQKTKTLEEGIIYKKPPSNTVSILKQENKQLRSQLSEAQNEVSKVREYVQIPVTVGVELYRRAMDIVAEAERARPSFQRFHKLVEQHYKLLKSGQGISDKET